MIDYVQSLIIVFLLLFLFIFIGVSREIETITMLISLCFTIIVFATIFNIIRVFKIGDDVVDSDGVHFKDVRHALKCLKICFTDNRDIPPNFDPMGIIKAQKDDKFVYFVLANNNYNVLYEVVYVRGMLRVTDEPIELSTDFLELKQLTLFLQNHLKYCVLKAEQFTK